MSLVTVRMSTTKCSSEDNSFNIFFDNFELYAYLKIVRDALTISLLFALKLVGPGANKRFELT